MILTSLAREILGIGRRRAVPAKSLEQTVFGKFPPPKLPFRFVVATRVSQDNFWSTPLGNSLRTLRLDADVTLCPNNSLGLPAVYNSAIRAAKESPATLIFIHDDVHLVDYYWPLRLEQSLSDFDVVGIAGCTRLTPNRGSWATIQTESEKIFDRPFLSGAVAHGKGHPAELMVYGPPNQQVKLLDGVFIAARSTTLLRSGAMFDERFRFHFYDYDFCRTASKKGLKLGTCPISLIHESIGDPGSPDWQQQFALYLEKWPN